MVMVSRIAILSTAAALFGVALGEVTISNPSQDLWWVAKSQNILAWDCKTSTHQTYTVLIANKDPKILVQPMPIISILNNFDCSEQITQDQQDQPAGTGYTILLANTLNSTEIFATSEEFEIKPLGSAFPAAVTPSSTTGNGTSPTGSSNSTAPTNSNAASSSTSFGFGFAAIGAILGLVVA